MAHGGLMTILDIVDSLIIAMDLRNNKEKLDTLFDDLNEKLLLKEREYSNAYRNSPEVLQDLLNKYAIGEAVKIESSDGQIRILVMENPNVYLDTPLREGEDKLFRLRHLMAIDLNLDFAIAEEEGNNYIEKRYRISESDEFADPDEINLDDEFEEIDIKKMN